jgi:hypothetical protein
LGFSSPEEETPKAEPGTDGRSLQQRIDALEQRIEQLEKRRKGKLP